MITKTYQKIKIAVPAQTKKTISERLKNDYKYATGFFFYDSSFGYYSDQALFSLKIGGNEIIPADSDVSLFCFNGQFSRNETLWDFTEERVAAASSLLECEIENKADQDLELTLYVLLKNEVV